MANSALSNNIKILRKKRGRTQEEMAHTLDLKRSTLNGYENGVGQPNIETLMAISKYFGIAIDTLIKVDMSKLSELQLGELMDGYDVYITGGKLRVLTSTVDGNNEETIEMVNEKASAGYSQGFADPEYIRQLQSFQLPFLSRSKKYRAFQIKGDSMLPIPDGSWIIAEYIENWYAIKDGDACIVLTLDDGIVFKLVENRIEKDKSLQLISMNKLYDPYSMPIIEVREIWKFVNYISSEMPEAAYPDMQLHKTVANLQRDLEQIKTRLE